MDVCSTKLRLVNSAEKDVKKIISDEECVMYSLNNK